ncbi:MAG: hypothetical protein M3Q23_02670 [Actinomycetota bacterium]|nr:hypothetical protein [Actinomycetota bacterium]
MRNRWVTPGAIKLHVALFVVAGTCLAAFWWQLDRALGGHTRSWGYAVEWPLFAAYGGWIWWKLLRDEPGFAEPEAPTSGSGDGAVGDPAAVGASPEEEAQDREMAAYNEYLAGLREAHRQPRP